MIRVVFVIFLCLATCFPVHKLFAQQSLSDSIVALVKAQTNYNELQTSFELIRKNRRNLGSSYIPVLKEFAQYSKNVNYEKGEMKAYDFIGLQYRYDENYSEAYTYHTKSLELANRLKDSTQMFYNYNNLGQVYRMQDINPVAIDYFHKALEVSNAVGNLRSSSFTLNTIGATLVVQKDYSRAMKYFRRSNEIAVQREDKRTMAYNYGNMGEVYLLTSNPDSAMYYFRKSRNLLVDLNSVTGMGVAEHLIGQAHWALNEYDNAIEKFELALNFHKSDNNKRYQSLCNCYLGKIALEKKEYNLAIKYLELAKQQASEINSKKNLVEIYDTFAELYMQQNLWEKAYRAKEESHKSREEINNEKNNSSIHGLEIRFETQEKEQQIALLSSQNLVKNQQILLSVFSSLALLLLLAVFVLLYFRRKKQNELKQQSLQQQLLRSQMNPHFLFNALGSIQNYMYRNETQKAAAYLGNFASLTRAVLEYSSVEFISLEDEIASLRHYVELEKMRLQNRFQYKIECSEDLELEFIKVPPMLVQPFVENAIKHGLRNLDYEGELLLSFKENNNELEIKIIDNGHGINSSRSKEDVAKTHRSMSMQIFRERREILSKKFRKNISFEVIDRSDRNRAEKGTEVKIVIPIKE